MNNQLSPAAQAVLDAANKAYWRWDLTHPAYMANVIAATLHAAADQVLPLEKTPWGTTLIPVLTSRESRSRLLALADELNSNTNTM